MSRLQNARADLGLLAVSALWGMTFPAIRGAMLEGASPLTFVAARFSLAAVIMLPFALRGLALSGRALLKPSIGLGLLLGAAYAMQTRGMQTTTAANSGFITGTSVVMVPFVDRVVRRTPLRLTAVGGGLLALGGLYVLAGIKDPSELISGRPGDLWTLASAFGYALYLVFLQDHLARFERWAFLCSQLAVVAVAAAILAPALETITLPLTLTVTGSIAFCALFATVGTGLLQFRFQEMTSPARAALIFALEPVFAAGFAVLILGEAPGPGALPGGALIVAGVVVAELGPRPPNPSDDTAS